MQPIRGRAVRLRERRTFDVWLGVTGPRGGVPLVDTTEPTRFTAFWDSNNDNNGPLRIEIHYVQSVDDSPAGTFVNELSRYYQRGQFFEFEITRDRVNRLLREQNSAGLLRLRVKYFLDQDH